MHASVIQRLFTQNFDDLFEKEKDGEEGRAHLVADSRREVLCLGQVLLPLLLLDPVKFLVDLSGLVVDVDGNGLAPQIRLIFEPHTHEVVVQVVLWVVFVRLLSLGGDWNGLLCHQRTD